MAGEFFVMEKLFRLGHEPALTMGNAKSIDILVRKPDGALREISVKAVCGGGKWGVSSDDESGCKNRIYVLLIYRDFDDLKGAVDVFVVPAPKLQSLKAPWFKGQGVYYSDKQTLSVLEKYRDAWTNV
jgi:hypothetical protein